MHHLGGKIITREIKRLFCKDIKKVFSKLLKTGNQELISAGIREYQPRQAVNALLSFIYDGEPVVKWSAIMAIGELVGLMADEDMESARVIIRRLMWNLNDESGGIGWGSPEAMAEILAGNNTLALEYHRMLLSYACEEGNFQENEIIQRGVLWGIGRISRKYPELVKKSASDLIKFLESDDAVVRGYASWIAGLLKLHEATSKLESLVDDDNEIQLFIDRELISCRVKDMAKEAMNKINT